MLYKYFLINQQCAVAFAFSSLKPYRNIVSIQILICPDKQCLSLENVLCQNVISCSVSINISTDTHYTDLDFNTHYTDLIEIHHSEIIFARNVCYYVCSAYVYLQ